jgi:hypothetical protein
VVGVPLVSLDTDASDERSFAKIREMRCEIPVAAVTVEVTVFSDVTPGSLIKIY